MAFYGRVAELGKLNEMYSSGAFEFAVIYGRRRVGKTALIREFVKGRRALFFTANESTSADSLLSLSRCIGGNNAAPVFGDYESALSAVFESAAAERLVFVIDEFPYLAGACRDVSSLLQIMIDRYRETSKLMLILCGSSVSFMENQVLGSESPLYGRRTAQFKMRPFTFFESLPFLTVFSHTDKAALYGMTGGVPEYLNRISARKSVRDNAVDTFFSTSGYFFEEPSNLIKQELREPSTYNVIIESIAGGASRLNEIAAKSGLEGNKCAKYLNSLIALGLIIKEYPFGEIGGRRSVYKLEDQMFRFWYRFVFPNMSAAAAGFGGQIYDNDVKCQHSAFMGLVFEEICKQWLIARAKENKLPFFVGDIGRWWGANPATRTQEEIDIMAAREDDALFAECKWKSAAVDTDVLQDLIRKSEMFGYKNAHHYIFAKGAFTDGLRAAAGKHGRVKLLDLGEMIESV
jgi:AAA+ ATPase superfamily predicted ATPase